jgi:hypothetical protein
MMNGGEGEWRQVGYGSWEFGPWSFAASAAGFQPVGEPGAGAAEGGAGSVGDGVFHFWTDAGFARWTGLFTLPNSLRPQYGIS